MCDISYVQRLWEVLKRMSNVRYVPNLLNLLITER